MFVAWRNATLVQSGHAAQLYTRDQGCRFPGCSNHRFLQGHHIKHWLHGGRTSLDNLTLVCSYHHRQIHEGGFSLRLTSAGEIEVRAPGGVLLPAQPNMAEDLESVDWSNDWSEGSIDAWTATPAWDGEAIYYGDVVDALLRRTLTRSSDAPRSTVEPP